MRKCLLALAIYSTTSGLIAQETGAAAGDSIQAAQSSNWQNWVFAGSALVTATVGVVIISLNSGTTSH